MLLASKHGDTKHRHCEERVRLPTVRQASDAAISDLETCGRLCDTVRRPATTKEDKLKFELPTKRRLLRYARIDGFDWDLTAKERIQP